MAEPAFVDTASVEEVRAAISQDSRSQMQRMIAGELYHASDPEIATAAARAKALAQRFNAVDLAAPDAEGAAREVLGELLGSYPASAKIVANLQVDYGFNVHLGEDAFINFDAILLDVCPITIGDGTLIGPRAQLLTPLHPAANHTLRRAGYEYGAPITLGENCWLGGGVTVCPGVTIGSNTVIGAGSVVTRDIPAGVFAAGSPARVIREL